MGLVAWLSEAGGSILFIAILACVIYGCCCAGGSADTGTTSSSTTRASSSSTRPSEKKKEFDMEKALGSPPPRDMEEYLDRKMGVGRESYMANSSHSHSRNISNAILAIAVAIPAILFHLTFLYRCPGQTELWSRVCEWGREQPLSLVNLIFFINVNLLFWIISLIQSSTWLIDPYWTIIPVMMGHYYATHPRAESDLFRSRAVISLLWLWSIRLTHSYFRRENWQWGEREDWRFSQLRKQHGRHWWWMSFFAVYVSQQLFLVGICLPLYAVHSNKLPWGIWDTMAASLCLAGILLAYYADTQLHAFMAHNEVLKELGAAPIPVLETGVWKHSRHPNYVGEQLWWWGLALFAWNLRQGWMAAGAFVNSACLAYVTVLVERKMLEKASRASAYRRYQDTTSVWIPWITFPTGKKVQ